MSVRPASDNSPRRARACAPGASRGPARLAGRLAAGLAIVLAGLAAAPAGVGVPAAGAPPSAAPGSRPDLAACAPAPPWLSVGTLPDGSYGALSACFARSSQAEAPLQLANDGPRALLIAVSGPVELDEYWFSGRVDAALETSLQGAGASGEDQVIVLGPHQRATLTIGRPPPAPGRRELRIAPARGVAAALAAVAWTFVHDARQRGPVPASVQRCVASTLFGIRSDGGEAQRALAPLRRCVLATAGRTASGLRALASTLLSGGALAKAIDPAEGGRRASPIELAIAGSPPAPVNPAIHIAIPELGSVVDGTRTVVRLTASGGTAPYRFYIWQEPGAAAVPSWVRLAPRGTLAIAPPAGASLNVNLMIYAVDATGDYSQDLP